MLAYIWAQDQKGLIGQKGKLPWHLPNDLAFFKMNTQGHTIVMGRKTFEGMGGKLLPDRQTIVLSHQDLVLPAGALLMKTKAEVLNYAQETKDLVFITGGSALYRLFENEADILYQTVIEGDFQGDAYFDSAFDFNEFKLIESVAVEADVENKYPHTFNTFARRIKD